MEYNLQDVLNIVNKAIDEFTADESSWADFLKRAAFFYKQNPADILTILYLKPNATACGSKDIWKRLKATVNDNAQPIPIIGGLGGKINYVYDISDTTSNYKIWQPNVNSQVFLNSLINTFDINAHGKTDFKSILDAKIHNEVLPYLEKDIVWNSFIENSVKLFVYSRCGLDTSEVSALGFELVCLFENNIDNFYNVVNRMIIKSAVNIVKEVEKCHYGKNKVRAADIADKVENTEKPQNTEKSENRRERNTEQRQYNTSGSFTKYTDEEISIARGTNLVDFLNSQGEELKRVGTNEYTMKVHDSMRISGSRFYWNSRSFGGNAVDFMMRYYGKTFQESVKILLDYNGYRGANYNLKSAQAIKPMQDKPKEQESEDEHKPIPNPLSDKTSRVYAYLTKSRRLDGDVVNSLIKAKKLYQDVKGNAVFPITDGKTLELTGAEIFGTSTVTRFKQWTELNANGFALVSGSNINSNADIEKTLFFESAIDLLSYYCLHKDENALLVSMAGLKDAVVLKTMSDYGLTPDKCLISSDNDEAGRKFAQKCLESYGIKSYRVNDDERFVEDRNIKDWNDLLFFAGESPGKKTVENSAQIEQKRETKSIKEKTFAEQVDDSLSGKLPFYTSLKICDTPKILLNVGCRQLPMLYTQRHLKMAVKPIDKKEHSHGLSVEQVKKLPVLINNPVMVLDSLSKNDSILIVTSEFDTVNNPIIVSIKPNGKGRYEVETVDTNFVTSVYGRNKFLAFLEKAISQDKILYCNKEKSQALYERWGEQYSELTNNLDYDIIIHQSRNIVNSKTNENHDISAEKSTTAPNKEQKEKYISSVIPNEKGIIGNTPFRYISNKKFYHTDKATALKIAERFERENIKYSGSVKDNEATVTTYGKDFEKVNAIINSVVNENKAAFEESQIQKNSAQIEQEKENKPTKETMQSEQPEDNFPPPNPNGEPTVTILWSEHSRFHDGETMSLSEANAAIASLDAAVTKGDRYFRTGFRIDFVMNGQPDYYVGRQDLGDGDGTLIEHIEGYHAYYKNNSEWENYILRNEGKEGPEADKAYRDMLLHEFVPYLKLHCNLSEMKRIAVEALQNDNLSPTETAYHTAMQEYVSKCRTMVNNGIYDLPPAPQLKDFDTELTAYKEHVREEIAQEAAAAGMTIEEYAANGYEPYTTGLPDLSVTAPDMQENSAQIEQKKTTAPLIHTSSDSSQLSLFPTVEEKIINRILSAGTNDFNGALRIYAQYQVGTPSLEMAEFLSKEYGNGGRGFTIDGNKYAVWFDEKGLTVNIGSSARYNNDSVHLSWTEAESRIHTLVKNGTYLSSERAALVRENEVKELSEQLWYLRQDFSDKAKENNYLPLISKVYDEKGGFPAAAEKIKSMLQTSESLLSITEEMKEFCNEYKYDSELMRFHFHKPNAILHRLEQIQIPPAAFPLDNNFKEELPTFITDDEVNDFLSRGGSYAGSDMSTYEFFILHADQKERQDYLKKAFGTGGFADYKSNISYDYKGIKIRRTYEKKYAEVFVNWKQAERSINSLIEKGLFFTEENKNKISEKPQADNYVKIDENTPTQENEAYKQPSAFKAKNFRITSDDFGAGSLKEKYIANVNAIKLLKELEDEKRNATPEEQNVLYKYVGWGGLADAFDSKKSNWTTEYSELKKLLSSEEYASARSSTLNAHYTQPFIISSMYKVLENLGFKEGKILEPSMGTGNFFGCLPEGMKNSKLYGVELDSISGRIAKQLYPNSNIHIKGFEDTDFQSNFFDAAIGNVPFGNYRVSDRDFKENDLIHDYFFKKSLDKIRPGGIIAFITSKGTLDKKDNTIRKYIAERADLLGAIRLPNNAFKNAGTDVTSDIIFLQKRDMPRNFDVEGMPDWVNISNTLSGMEINSYFINNPQMILGEMTEVLGRYGTTAVCKPIENTSLETLLNTALDNIKGIIPEREENASKPYPSMENGYKNSEIIPENYRNFCYAEIDGKVFYRENENMLPQKLSENAEKRIKGMIGISNILQELIRLQKENCSDETLQKQQALLSSAYGRFTEQYGLLSSKTNKSLFSEDDTVPLLLSLENLDSKGELESKADIFTKRTIMPYIPVTSVETASEALIISISEKAKVDLDFMSKLCSKSREEIINCLEGVIFENPLTGEYETADEYLSGNVKEKLKTAEKFAEMHDRFERNVKALKAVQPEDLKPSEITAELGSVWIPAKYYEEFVYELLNTPKNFRTGSRPFGGNPFESEGCYADNSTISVDFNPHSSTFAISNKGTSESDRYNILAAKTYGTKRINAYKIIEDSLNLKPIKIYDYYETPDGKRKAVLNEKETMIATEKQRIIQEKFKEWVFDDSSRTQELCRIYNDKFNCIRPREFDGSHITFAGMNPEIKLMKHQKDAVAHTLYGGNTLLAHVVGAGKTFEMAASAMESKRLGLCSKSMIVVPKSIVQQTAKEFLQLYPGANILVPSENDFTAANRKRFCSRIATGNYDAVIISHNQFEKIPLSLERQIDFIRNEIEEITNSLEELKRSKSQGRGFTVKEMESTKKSLKVKLEKLINSPKRDTVITFEDLGVDKLYVDEAHTFKNLYFSSKMGNNIAGINASSQSQRAADLYMKCRYMDEKTNSKGVVFATGTPVSNSMAELYTMQKFLQNGELKARGLQNFDAWASCFGKVVQSLELAPEGKGYRMKTRFAKFFNLPELMSMFKEIADIKTADVLKLPVPKANHHTVSTEASKFQKSMIDSLAARAERIRSGAVNSKEDNMLKVTNSGRLLALDQRIANSLLPDDPNSKVNTCVKNVFDIWNKTTESKSTQMIFCDLSTPKTNEFNVYDDIRTKLINLGVSPKEIAFIHDCKTDEQRKELFAKVRKGEVRIVLGSTSKLGTGTNCQTKLKAVHHLDCPWKPSDLEQRNGRIIRQGNENNEVDIYSYVTKGTFDSYLYQTVENKQRFIGQIMTSKSPVRSAEDVDESVLNYAQIKAIASGDPKIKEKMDLDMEVTKLRTLLAEHRENRRKLQNDIHTNYPAKIKTITEQIQNIKTDIALAYKTSRSSFNGMVVNGINYTNKKEAGNALLEFVKTTSLPTEQPGLPFGSYRGFKAYLSFSNLGDNLILTLQNKSSFNIFLGDDAYGNITRIDNVIDNLPNLLERSETKLNNVYELLQTAKQEVDVPFPRLDELRQKEAALEKLDAELSLDKPTSETAKKQQPPKEQSRKTIKHQNNSPSL